MTATRKAFSQPKGLVSLFFVEMWERFGFYAVQTVLVLYLTKSFGFSDDMAYDTFSATAAFIFASPFIGGYIADKWLGYRQSILLGAVILIVGYWLLMVPSKATFYWALGLLIVGNGFFKGCISTLLGTLYHDNDPRRDGGFTIFYMGINIGSFIAPPISGFVSESLGWSYVFGFAGMGLVIALITALVSFGALGTKGLPPEQKVITIKGIVVKPLLPTLIGSLIATVLVAAVIHNALIANGVFSLCALACVVVVFVISMRLKGHERSNMLVLSVLVVFSILFWAMYNQTFSSLTLFTDRIVDRHVLGYEIPTAMFQSVNPFFIVALTPVFVLLWNRLALKHSVFSSPSVKFTLAILGMALAYLVLVIGVRYPNSHGQVGVSWLIFSYFLQTASELMISPIGLSLVTELAPKKYQSMMMGGWFLSISVGYSLGDYLAKFTSIPADLIASKAVAVMLPYYAHAFLLFFAITGVVGLLLWCLVPALNRATFSDKRLAAMKG